MRCCTHKVFLRFVRRLVLQIFCILVLGITKLQIDGFAKIFKFLARRFVKLSVAVGFINEISGNGVSLVCRLLQPPLRVLRIVRLFKIEPTETVHCKRISYDCSLVQIFKIIRPVSEFFVIVIDISVGLLRRKIDFRSNLNDIVADRFELFVALDRNFCRHLVRIGADGFAFVTVPRIIQLRNFFIRSKQFYDFIHE